MNGTMTQQWTVWCDKCWMHDTRSGNKRSCTSEFKKCGWTKKKFWLCPVCSKFSVHNRNMQSHDDD